MSDTYWGGETVVGEVTAYDNGQERVVFAGSGDDWYVWSVHRQSRLATYDTREELEAAYDRSNNGDGPYGCARLRLYAWHEDGTAS